MSRLVGFDREALMRLRAAIAPDNPARAWARRVLLGTRSRPDVQVLRLERRLEIMERLVDLDRHAASWAREFVAVLSPQQIAGSQMQRFGSVYDGGYVLPTDILRTCSGIVSVGVGDNNEADVALADLGLAVHAWDHTVARLPVSHDGITFHKIGIGTGPEDVRPLEEIITGSFGARAERLALLIDAEGAEWFSLWQAPQSTLDRLSLISIELHDLGNMLLDPEPYLSVLRRLHENFVPVSVHANNYRPVWDVAGVRIADALEVTYVNRDLIGVAQLSEGNCAAPLLAPCCPDLPDVELPWARPSGGAP